MIQMSYTPDEFANQVCKQAIARACVALGFKNAEAAALDVLSDVVREYIEKVSASTLKIAELHGRVQPGIQDALQALDGLKPTPTSIGELRDFAFSEAAGTSKAGASSSSSSSSSSGDAVDGGADQLGPEIDNEMVESLSKSSASAWHQPFPHIVPNFPIRQKLKPEIRLPDEEVTRGADVPSHLPAFPPVHTYKRSHGGGNKKKAPAAVSTAAAKEQGASKKARTTITKSLSLIEDECDIGENV